MKTIHWSGVVLLGLALGASNESAAADLSSGYQATERGPHHTIWQKVVSEPGPSGEAAPQRHAYVELGTGLNYIGEDGLWAPSNELIESYPGGAVARHGQHQVIFANNLATLGAIDVQTPDGKRLTSHVLGLCYANLATGESVFIAEVKDCQGEVLPPNQVIYRSAFTGLDCSVRYTYTKAGLEQDIILHARPPAPETYGLDPRSGPCVLQVLTEFVDPPQPAKFQSAVRFASGAAVANEDLDFGAMKMLRGKVLFLGPAQPLAEIPVTKQWAKLDGRDILIEQVPLPDIEAQLAALPKAQGASVQPATSSVRRIASAKRQLPPRPTAKKPGNAKMQLAGAAAPLTGLVLDYNTISASATNFTFVSDTYSTYFISSTVNIYGTMVCEPRCVLKFAPNASLNLLSAFYTPRAVFLGDAYKPIVMTARDDDSCGEQLNESTHNISGYYANPALGLNLSSATAIPYLRVAYAKQAISVSGANVSLTNCQFAKCETGVAVDSRQALLRNVLFAGTLTNFALKGSAAIDVQNATISAASCLAANTGTSTPSAALTNSILANVTNLTSGVLTLTGAYNAFYATTNFGVSTFSATDWPFQNAGAGDYYLNTNSSLRDVGTTNIDAALLAGLAKLTTYPPIIYSNSTISVETTFSPQAQRDTDAIDLGYHYMPLDWIFGGVTANANITFAPGTAVAWFRTTSGWNHAGYGIHLADYTTATFNGQADAPTRWVRHNTVQECVNRVWDNTYRVGPGGIDGWASSRAAAPTVQARFLKCSILTGEPGVGCHFRDDYGYLLVRCSNCEFYGGGIGGYDSAQYHTNCLFERTWVWLEGGRSDNADIFRNCTFWRGGLSINRSSGGQTLVSVRDCALDGTLFPYTDPVAYNTNYTDYDFNAFVSGQPRTVPNGPNDVILTNFNWQTSWLGSYYLPADSLLIDTGWVTADVAGLYHFTTQTDQTPEQTSQVDIGYHYVALDANGNPLDYDSDGTPDYLEDFNGNGTVDSGETDWQSATDMGLKVIITQPKRNSNLP